MNWSYLRFIIFFVWLGLPKSLIQNYTNLERYEQRRNKRKLA